jgi:peptidyl-prolyl cis-trans isomerase SurA
MIKYLKIAIIKILCMTVFCSGLAATVLDQSILIVGKTVMTQHDAKIIDTAMIIGIDGPPISDSDERHARLKGTLVNQALLLNLAQQQQIQVNDQQLKQAENNITQQLGITLPNLLKEWNKHDLTADDFKQYLKQQISIAIVQQMLIHDQVQISPAQIKTFLKSHRLESMRFHLMDFHITSQAESGIKQANQLITKLKQSKDPQSAAMTGKDLGWQNFDALPTLFAQALNQSQLDQQSVLGPILAPNGIHVLYVLGQQGQPLTESQAGNYLYQQAINEKMPLMIEKIRKQAYIKWLAQPNVSD